MDHRNWRLHLVYNIMLCNIFFHVEYHEISHDTCVFHDIHISLDARVNRKKIQVTREICSDIPLEYYPLLIKRISCFRVCSVVDRLWRQNEVSKKYWHSRSRWILPFAYFHVQATNAHPKKWNFRRLSGYELAGNKIFLRHGSSGDWGSFSAAWVEWSAIKGMFITWESILGRHLVLLTLFFSIYLIY